jgi:hypothetical protein
MNRKIELITVCKKYSDFLKITLPINKKYFDNVLVITDQEDIETQELCKKENVNFVIYDGFNKMNAKFNFGGARNFGIQNLKYYDWVVFLDSDIIIEDQNFRRIVDIDNIDINKFYGSYRRFIPTHKDYLLYRNGLKTKDDFEAIEGSGCGFFQCINLNSDVARYYGLANLYKDSYSSIEVDINFLKLWCPRIDPENHPRLVKTNIELLHLGTSDGRHHYGRDEKDPFFKE